MARELSKTFGCRYLTLDAKRDDPRLIRWYQKYGFVHNEAESQLVRLLRKLKAGTQLRQASMRFDLFLEGELGERPTGD